MTPIALIKALCGFVKDRLQKRPHHIPYSCQERIDRCTNMIDFGEKPYVSVEIIDFLNDPINGCKGRWSFGYRNQMFFEDASTATLVKMRFG